MRPIHLAEIDIKTRPVVLLSRSVAIPVLKYVTVAPITSTIRGISVEVLVGRQNNLDHDSVVNVDNIQTIPKEALGRRVGALLPEQEYELTAAIHTAFDLY